MLRTIIDFESAETLIRSLATAHSARRLYGATHRQSQEQLERFRKLLRGYFEDESERFYIAVRNGRLTHEGVPIGTGSSFLQLAALIEGKQCVGVGISPKVASRELARFLDWISSPDLDGQFPAFDGIELIESEGGIGPGFDEDDDELPPHLAAFRLPFRIYRSAAEVLDRVMTDARSGSEIDFQEVFDVTHWTAEEAFRSGTQMLGPIQLLKKDSYTFQHSINVFLIATTLAQPLARNPEELAGFARAALLHDIGKSLVPNEIIYKTGALTADEYSVICRHPEFGARILLGYRKLDPLAAEVAYCHHMRDNGHGYPNPDVPVQAGPISNIVQISDMFEALTARRPYKEAMSVSDAVRTIRDTPGMESKMPAIWLLLGRLTVSPPGAEVVLDTGERGVVLNSYQDAPAQPRVLIMTDRGGTALERPIAVDLRDDTKADGRRVERVVLAPESLRGSV